MVGAVLIGERVGWGRGGERLWEERVLCWCGRDGEQGCGDGSLRVGRLCIDGARASRDRDEESISKGEASWFRVERRIQGR
jgi:hypothetical protein